MQEKNSKKMDVSYGVDKSQESADITPKEAKKSKKSTKKTKKVVAKKEKVEEPRPKKKTLIDEINEMKANNDVNSPEFREKMSKLEKILGVDEVNPFGTNEPDIFEDKIKGMTYSDMRDLAYKVGINPFMAQSELKASLLKEFNASNKNNMRNIMPTASSVVKLDPKNPKHAETLRILGEI